MPLRWIDSAEMCRLCLDGQTLLRWVDCAEMNEWTLLRWVDFADSADIHRPPPSLWPWPSPQDGLGQGWLRLKWAKGQFWLKIGEKMKVLKTGLALVENLSGPQESIFNLSRGPQLHFGEKNKKQ